MKDKKIYLGAGLAFLLLMTISLSYAYFSASVSGNDNAKDVVVNAGTLSLVYADGPEIKVENIRPGKTITKEVTVKNTGTLDTNYNIIWQSLINEITNNELVLSATCQRLNANGTEDGTCKPITELPVKAKTISKIFQLKQDSHTSIHLHSYSKKQTHHKIIIKVRNSVEYLVLKNIKI